MRTLIVSDFDWSFIDEDCDTYLIEHLDSTLLPELHELKYRLQWTDLMDYLFSVLHFRSHPSPATINSLITTLPFHPDMHRAILHATSHGSSVAILSDANTYVIKTFLEYYALDEIIKTVISNPSKFDKNGRLRIQRYTPAHVDHGCLREVFLKAAKGRRTCAANLCKGKETKRLKAEFDRVVYIGDGMNDACAVLGLGVNDVVMARKGRMLERVLKEYQEEVKARVVVWETGTDVLREFIKIFGKVKKEKELREG